MNCTLLVTAVVVGFLSIVTLGCGDNKPKNSGSGTTMGSGETVSNMSYCTPNFVKEISTIRLYDVDTERTESQLIRSTDRAPELVKSVIRYFVNGAPYPVSRESQDSWGYEEGNTLIIDLHSMKLTSEQMIARQEPSLDLRPKTSYGTSRTFLVGMAPVTLTALLQRDARQDGSIRVCQAEMTGELEISSDQDRIPSRITTRMNIRISMLSSQFGQVGGQMPGGPYGGMAPRAPYSPYPPNSGGSPQYWGGQQPYQSAGSSDSD